MKHVKLIAAVLFIGAFLWAYAPIMGHVVHIYEIKQDIKRLEKESAFEKAKQKIRMSGINLQRPVFLADDTLRSNICSTLLEHTDDGDMHFRLIDATEIQIVWKNKDCDFYLVPFSPQLEKRML